jgi:chromatin modification-related protein YNG2
LILSFITFTFVLIEMLPKLAARESQFKELLSKKEILTDFDKTKVEKISEKIKADYARADDWSSQKEALSKSLWRSVYAHQHRLNQEIEKVSPALIKQVESSLPPQAMLMSASSLGSASSSASLSASLPIILANLKSPSIEIEAATLGLGGSLKRKHGASSHSRESPSHSIKQGRHSSSDRMASPFHSVTSAAINPFVPPSSHPAMSKKALKSSGLSSMLAKVEPVDDMDGDADAAGDADGDGGGDGEKDNKIYCHCQRVSFGEVSVSVCSSRTNLILTTFVMGRLLNHR